MRVTESEPLVLCKDKVDYNAVEMPHINSRMSRHGQACDTL